MFYRYVLEILVLIPIGTGYPYTRIQVRTRELTLESGIMDTCLNRLCRVQCVSSRELHGARRADSNRLARFNAHEDRLLKGTSRRDEATESIGGWYFIRWIFARGFV